MRVSQALVLLAVAAAPVAAMADNINVSTGTATYLVTPPTGPTVTAVAVTPNGAWTAVVPGGAWVAPDAADGTTNVAAGMYVYTTTFTLTTTSSNLSGSFASDNEASATLTGGTISGTDALGSNTGADSFKTATSFMADDLGPGTYTLTFDVNNDGPGASPTGLIVGASTSTVVPEPSSLALLGTGLLGAAGIARRKFFSR